MEEPDARSLSLLRGRLILKIAVASLFPVAVVATLGFFWEYREHRKAVEEIILQERREEALALASAVQAAGEQADLRSIVAIYLQNVRTERRNTFGGLGEVGLSKIFVVDAAGIVLAGGPAEILGRPLVDAMDRRPMGLRAVLSGKETSATDVTVGRDGKLIHISVPLHLDPKAPAGVTGAVHLLEPYDLLEEALALGLWRRASVALALALALVASLTLILGRVVVAPVRRLADGMRRAREALEVTVPVTSKDEIGDLTRSFNHMVAELHRKCATLAALYAIERTVNQSLPLDVILTQALEKVCKAMAVEAGGFYLLGPDGEAIVLRVHRGLSPALAKAAGRIRLGDDVAAQAISLRGPVAVDLADYPTPRLAPILATEGIRHLASAPVIARGRVLGALNLGSHRGHPFTAEELDLLGSIGQQVGTSVENAQLYAATARQLSEMTALDDMGRAFASSLDLDDRLKAFLERMIQVMGAQRAALSLVEPENANRYRLSIGYDPSKADPWLRRLDLWSERYPEIQEAVRRRRPLVIPDVFAEPILAPVREHLAPLRLRSLVVLPLIVRERAIGAVSLGYVGQGRTLTDDEIRFCQSMVDRAAAAIANAQLFEQVARAKAEWENTFDAIPDLVAIIDAENRLVRVNRALAERLRKSPEQLIGQPCYAAVHGTEAPWPGCPHAQALARGEPTTAEVEDPHLGGIFHVTTSPLVNAQGRALGCVHVVRDITEMKRLEEEARQRQRFEDLSRSKSAFIATMSHELRSPLNAIIGFSELVLGQGVGPLTEKQARYLDHIRESGKHLLDLINEILDISQVEAGKIELALEPVRLHDTAEATLALVHPQAEKAGVALGIDIPQSLPPVRADRVRLRQILFNLLSNGIKFTPAGGTISLTARRVPGERCGTGEPGSGGRGEPSAPPPRVPESPSPGEGTFLKITVRDTGIGIKGEDIPKLFKEFGQLEAGRAPEKQGTGLGLSLTKRLVDLHGGRIWVESEGEGRGSTFAFTLPVAGPPPSAAAAL